MASLPKTVPTMTTELPVDLSDHYKNIAEDYDNFYQALNQAIVSVLLRKLDLQPHHLVVDVGSGTGFMAEKLFEASKLQTPIWCVDPSAEMQEVAQRRSGINRVLKTAEEFFDDSENSDRFDKIFSIAAAHHFLQPLEVCKGIERSLRPGGTCLFLEPGEALSLPLFKSAERLLAETVTGMKHGMKHLILAGFDVEVFDEQLIYSVTKSQWYERLRGRCWSVLNHLSDQQIEDGIKELEKEKFSRVKWNDSINFVNPTVILVAKKRDK